jgi:hypothetical protein
MAVKASNQLLVTVNGKRDGLLLKFRNDSGLLAWMELSPCEAKLLAERLVGEIQYLHEEHQC